MHAYTFFNYFGVNYTVMRLTSQDYLIRSADGLFVPLTVVAAVGLAALWGYRLVRDRLPTERRSTVLWVFALLALVVGLLLVGVALVATVAPMAFSQLILIAVPGLSLAIGVLLLACASRIQRSLSAVAGMDPVRRRVLASTAVMEWAALLVLVSVGLFWSVGDYSAAVGTGRGHDVESALPNWPDVVVYSAQSLRSQEPVREVACVNPDAGYRFRYEGLKLVLQSSDQYFFLPAGWTRGNGVAVVLPRVDSLRLEFMLPAPAAVGPRSTC